MSRTRAYKAIEETAHSGADQGPIPGADGQDTIVVISIEAIKAASLKWRNKNTGEIRDAWQPGMGPEWEEVGDA